MKMREKKNRDSISFDVSVVYFLDRASSSHLSISFDVSVVYFLDESFPFGRGGRNAGCGARRPGLARRLRSANVAAAAAAAASEVGQPARPPLEGLRRREWGDRAGGGRGVIVFGAQGGGKSRAKKFFDSLIYNAAS